MSLSNNFITTRPSLQLNFISGNSIDPRITFTRNSIASYVNKKGYVAYAAANQPRLEHAPAIGDDLGLLIESSKTNYIASTADFTTTNGYWFLPQTDSNFIFPHRSVSPDGTLSADLLLDSTSSARHAISSTAITLNTGLSYTASVFVKAYENTIQPAWMTLSVAGLFTSADRFGVAFNIATGQLGTGDTRGNATLYNVSSEDYGHGWWRISVSGNTGVVGNNTLRMHIAVNIASDNTIGLTRVGDGGTGFYIWGAQLEQSKQQTSFIPSTETFISRSSTASYIGSDGYLKIAAANTARYEYSVIDLTILPRLKYETFATNLYNYSEQIDTYALTGATVTANNIASPDGTTSADKLVEDTSTTNHDAHQTLTSIAAGAATTVSVFFKAAERSMATLEFVPSSSFTDSIAPTAFFSLTAGTVANTINAAAKDVSIVYYGNGWYRCSLTATPISSGSIVCNMGMTAGLSNTATYTGDGTSGLYIWGAQAEAGNIATSYIATGATILTRSADVLTQAYSTRSADEVTISGSNFNSFYNNNQGTLVTEATIKYRQDDNHITASVDGSPDFAWQHGLYLGSADSFYGARYGSDGIASRLLSTVANVPGTYDKIAVSYNLSTGNITTRSNGAGSGTSSYFLPGAPSYSAPTSLQIGRTDGSWYLNGWIKSLTYYPEQSTDAQLVSLTKRS